MTWKVFFADYCEDKIVEANHARIATKDEILHSMDCVLHMPNNFIGIVDENNATLQFVVNDDKTIDIDLPVPASRGSYTKTTDLAECLKVVRGLGDSVDPSQIVGLVFQPW
jgi:hypothetical protein